MPLTLAQFKEQFNAIRDSLSYNRTREAYLNARIKAENELLKSLNESPALRAEIVAKDALGIFSVVAFGLRFNRVLQALLTDDSNSFATALVEGNFVLTSKETGKLKIGDPNTSHVISALLKNKVTQRHLLTVADGYQLTALQDQIYQLYTEYAKYRDPGHIELLTDLLNCGFIISKEARAVKNQEPGKQTPRPNS